MLKNIAFLLIIPRARMDMVTQDFSFVITLDVHTVCAYLYIFIRFNNIIFSICCRYVLLSRESQKEYVPIILILLMLRTVTIMTDTSKMLVY